MLSHLKRNKSMKLGLPRTTKNCDSRELPKRWECGGGSPLLTAVGGQLSNGAITRFRFLGTTQFVITNNQNLISPPDTTWSRKSELLLCGRNLESLSLSEQREREIFLLHDHSVQQCLLWLMVKQKMMVYLALVLKLQSKAVFSFEFLDYSFESTDSRWFKDDMNSFSLIIFLFL